MTKSFLLLLQRLIQQELGEKRPGNLMFRNPQSKITQSQTIPGLQAHLESLVNLSVTLMAYPTMLACCDSGGI